MKKEQSNAGFSMVELIIVIAIMAILIAILAPQYIRYVEKSRITSDNDLIANVHDVIAMAIADENIERKPVDGYHGSLQDLDAANFPDFVTQIENNVGGDLASVHTKLQSKNFRGQDIDVEITTTQQVTVRVTSPDGLSSLEW
ncbi:MAG: prepilin-type N-terminal cleavage/methylation domain-containing protein [Lachnospiraceae bacterium]|nr:prepilin-type N-terminal cleavage/methylation domain-containing protein [Lachnospiraceae bacterium]